MLVEVDTTVDVGTVLARIATDASPGEAHADEHMAPDAGRGGAARGRNHRGRAAKAPPSPTAAPEPEGNGHAARRYSPVVQRIAAEHGVDLDQVEGTGRGGRVRKQDVLAFVERGSAEPQRTSRRSTSRAPTARSPSEPRAEPERGAPAPAGGETLSRMRRSIGEHMKRSLETAATCTTWIEADMTRRRGRAQARSA